MWHPPARRRAGHGTSALRDDDGALLSGLGFAECQRRFGHRHGSLGVVLALAAVVMIYVEGGRRWGGALLYGRNEQSATLSPSSARGDSTGFPVIDALRRGHALCSSWPPIHQIGADACYWGDPSPATRPERLSDYVTAGIRQTHDARRSPAGPGCPRHADSGDRLTTWWCTSPTTFPPSQPWLAFSEREVEGGGLRLVKRDGDEFVFEVTPSDRVH